MGTKPPKKFTTAMTSLGECDPDILCGKVLTDLATPRKTAAERPAPALG